MEQQEHQAATEESSLGTNLSVKMYAIIEHTTNNVVYMWVGEDESLAKYDKSKYYFVEMTQENSPAHCPGKYINNKFVKEF